MVLAAGQVGCSGGSNAPTVAVRSSTVTVTAAKASGGKAPPRGTAAESGDHLDVDPGRPMKGAAHKPPAWWVALGSSGHPSLDVFNRLAVPSEADILNAYAPV